MDENHEGRIAGPNQHNFLVVPHRLGPLVSLDSSGAHRATDDFDQLIDDVFPDVEERPGWFDAVLVVTGAGLLAWSWIGGAPGIVTVIGAIALALGCILPIRSAWRRAQQRREQRRRAGLLEKGVPIDVSSPAAAALVGAYADLIGLATRSDPEVGRPAITAAHGALLEVASLLKGRSPTSERELGYVDIRAITVAELADALRDLPVSPERPEDNDSTVDPDALVAAREELDRIAPFNSLTRLEELIAEARTRRHDRS